MELCSISLVLFLKCKCCHVTSQFKSQSLCLVCNTPSPPPTASQAPHCPAHSQPKTLSLNSTPTQRPVSRLLEASPKSFLVLKPPSTPLSHLAASYSFLPSKFSWVKRWERKTSKCSQLLCQGGELQTSLPFFLILPCGFQNFCSEPVSLLLRSGEGKGNLKNDNSKNKQ